LESLESNFASMYWRTSQIVNEYLTLQRTPKSDVNDRERLDNAGLSCVICHIMSVCQFAVCGSSPTSVVPEGKLIIGAERHHPSERGKVSSFKLSCRPIGPSG
jgi:hypothetical protein